MASTSLTSLKTSISSASTTTSSEGDRHYASHSQTAAAAARPQPDEDNDSGDEWDMGDIGLGELIIDLEADLQKDEMKKNDARNSNNNNSGKASTAGGKNPQASAIRDDTVLNSSEKIDHLAKGTKSAVPVGGSNSSQASGKAKSKSKKSNKSSVSKHGGTLNPTASAAGAKSVSSLSGEIPNGNRAVKAESSSSKSGRSHKKHNKNSNSSDKKNELGGNKEGREKSSKAAKSSKHINQSPTNAMLSMAGLSQTTTSAPGLPPTSRVRHSVNAACFSSTSCSVGNLFATAANDNTPGVHVSLFGKTDVTQVIEAPVMASTAHLGKHRKTSSLPSPMKYQLPAIAAKSPSPLASSAPNGALAVQSSDGKRERNSMHGLIQATGNKKAKLEKETKSYASGMTPNYGEGATKPEGRSHANVAMDLPGHSSNLQNDCRMSVTQKKGDKKLTKASNGQHGKSARTSPSGPGAASFLDGQTNASGPRGDVPTPSEQQRTVGTVTTFADIGVSTEPESLGPCEPGTSVHLSGIVWHETESGVLVVNVTWRNRSYVGTLLDATKHDWAPPRIPDADSDAEYRVKSVRNKRQRGANVNGTDAGRKGRKSATAANSNTDEYKCSPSSNKRRSTKMSESDVCSGNDGEICATPSKSAKRARLSRTAAAKQAAKKVVSAVTVKESSGDGTSGSGSGSSSACSSPVFMECRFANCKKRYKDDNALKYHEVHAHQGEDIDDADKVTPEDRDSNAADSPKDSSVEELAVSDFTGSPNEVEEAPNAVMSSAMETDAPAAPSAQAPFVVTQQSSQMPQTERFPSAYQAQNQAPHNSVKTTHGGEAKRTRDEFSATFESSVVSSCRLDPGDAISAASDAVSPYTLTDSQSNDSISLKAHLQAKPERAYHSSRATAPYAGSSPPITSRDHVSFLERTTAADNESAQAVETLLQLQENSQDQLPGLTPYNQAAAQPTPALSLPDPKTSVSSQPHSPNVSVDKSVPEPHLKHQLAPHAVAPQFRGHSKDGTPLPRMSVGVASPRYAGGSYTHGAAAPRSAQERSPRCAPAGPKTVKGKTVPIPTDPQQTRVPVAPQPTSIMPGPVASAKKTKRKKPKSEAGKSVTESLSKIGHVFEGGLAVKEDAPKPNMTDQSRIKQEDQHAMQPAIAPYHRAQRDGLSLPAGGNTQTQPGAGNVKLEPGAKTAGRLQGYAHPNHLHAQRHLYPDTDVSVRPAVVSKDTVNKFIPQERISDLTTGRVPHLHHAPSPNFSAEGQERAEPKLQREDRLRSFHSSAHAMSRSLPGSRSLTPVNPAAGSQPGYGQNPQQVRDSTTPVNSQNIPAPHRPHLQNKETASPPSPLLGRRLSAEGTQQKRLPSFPQAVPLYGYGINTALSCEMGSLYPAQFMNDPKVMQHYSQIIQHEIEKDQKLKEPEQPDRSSSSSRRPRTTPSPNHQPTKTARSKSPSRTEERRAGDSPPKVQNFPPPIGAQLQASQRVLHGSQHAGHAPRGSPVPHGNVQPTLKKPVAATSRAPSRGLSPRPQAAPSPMAGSRPRPRTETERHHKREPSLGERPQVSSRTTPTVAPSRKIPPKEGYPDQSPDKVKSSHPMAAYASPGALPGAGIPMQYFAGPYQPHHLVDHRSFQPYLAAAASPFMLHPHPGTAQFYHGGWPHGVPPSPAVVIGPEKAPSHPDHPAKLSRDRSSSGSRSPYREEGDRQPRDGVRVRDTDSYSSSKDRRSSDGRPLSRKSVTPDPKVSLAVRNPPNEGSNPGADASSTQMQTHLHHHHHIHEGFPLLPSSHQYQLQMAAASAAVMAGSEAAALAQYPKRDLP